MDNDESPLESQSELREPATPKISAVSESKNSPQLSTTPQTIRNGQNREMASIGVDRHTDHESSNESIYNANTHSGNAFCESRSLKPFSSNIHNSNCPEEMFDFLPAGQYGCGALQQDFDLNMSKEGEKEQALLLELEYLMAFYGLWTAVPSQHEEKRSSKRLRTRVVFIAKRQEELQGKHVQYTKIRQAFAHALNLLDNP